MGDLVGDVQSNEHESGFSDRALVGMAEDLQPTTVLHLVANPRPAPWWLDGHIEQRTDEAGNGHSAGAPEQHPQGRA